MAQNLGQAFGVLFHGGFSVGDRMQLNEGGGPIGGGFLLAQCFKPVAELGMGFVSCCLVVKLRWGGCIILLLLDAPLLVGR